MLNTTAAAAADYHERGWKPVPVNRKSKKPIGKDWQNKPYSPTQFNGNSQNVGIQLGAISGGLVDIDLDEKAAIGLAPEFLPPTGAVFGRNSKPCSHQLYLCGDLCTGEKSAIQFRRYVDGKQANVIVEVRTGSDGKGAATVFPPSMHVTGETVLWASDGEPSRVTGDLLKRAVLKLAVAVLLQPNYPNNGSRHEGALALGGVLARAGWSADDIEHVMRVLARNAHDDEITDRVEAAVSAVRIKVNGQQLQGLPSLAKVWGNDAADTLGRWLSMQADDDGRRTITLRAGKLHEIANEAEAALIAADVPFYVRGGDVVRPIIEDVPASKGRRMQVVPLHAFDAPEAGSGKSYLVDIASSIATGEIAPVIAAGRNEEETEKRLAAELMSGQPIISIDNLNGDLAGDFLCQAVERLIIKPRILGLSKNKRIENTVTIFCNGNNIRLVGDVVRRVIRCSLDPNVERPELRSFRGDPVSTVLENRGPYIAAVLTIVRAYVAASYPNPCSSLASFSDWSLLVRSPLVWLGYADPVETMEAARADDPSRENLHAIVAAWLRVIDPNKRMTAGEIGAKASSTADDPDVLILNKAISAVATPPGQREIDAMRLGRWLGRNKGRVVNNMKIFGEPDPHTKQQVWWIGPAATK